MDNAVKFFLDDSVEYVGQNLMIQILAGDESSSRLWLQKCLRVSGISKEELLEWFSNLSICK